MMLVSSRYDRAAMSEVHGLGGQRLDPREVLVERFQRRKYGEQRRPGDWLHDEPTAFLSHNGFVTRSGSSGITRTDS